MVPQVAVVSVVQWLLGPAAASAVLLFAGPVAAAVML